MLAVGLLRVRNNFMFPSLLFSNANLIPVLVFASLIPRIWCPRLVVLGVASLIPRIWCPVWRCWVLRV